MVWINMEDILKWAVISFCILTARGYKSGAPDFVCTTMMPGHGGSQATSNSQNPYTISPSKTQTENGKVRVMVTSPSGETFAGFFLQARSASTGNSAIGMFTEIPDNVKTVNCGEATNNGVTQKDNVQKKGVELEWEAPANFEGPINFVGTVVKSYTTFYVGMKSSEVQVVKRDVGPGTSGISTTVEPKAGSSGELQQALADIYAGCGMNKNCLGSPEGCVDSRSCKAVLSVSVLENIYVVDMMANNSKYVAVGFSSDNRMGGDTVAECVHEDNNDGNGVKVYRSWNVPNAKQNSRSEEQNGVSLVKGIYSDGSIYCRINHDSKIQVDTFDFDLDKKKYFTLLAAGSALKANSVGFHDVAFTSSTDQRLMSDFKPLTANDPFYNDCNTLKNCFGYPDGCVSKQTCTAIVSISVSANRYTFEMKAKTDGYVAVGLSDDQSMGGDSVVECVHDANSPSNSVRAYMSWNEPGSKSNVRKRQLGINLLNGTYVDGILYCRFTRDPRTIVEDVTFDLVNDQYHILLAAGSSVRADGVGFHNQLYTASGQKRPLTDVGAFTAASKILLRLHGAFMIAAWIGTASLGIVLARYYKQTWVGSTCCGKDLWFVWHRFFMVLTWVLTVVAFVLIFVEIGDWVSKNSQTHAILGCITTALCFIQPFMAAFRPHPNTSKRPLFNWAHWLVGNSAHIVAIVTIFFAVQLNKAELPDWMDWILVGFVAFYVIMHLVLSCSGCVSENKGSSRITSFPMKDMNTRGSLNMDRKQDAPHAGFRKCMLTIHVLGIVALTVVLILLVVLAPIDQNWSEVKDAIMSV
uniref:Ferric-chelate reductase 1 homolog n=1 Tax=Clastoptera arizonana TaxID=38151 RepID=A0A1B6DIZ9_9HEMI